MEHSDPVGTFVDTTMKQYLLRICYQTFIPCHQKFRRKTGMGQVSAKICQVPWMFSDPFHDHAVDSWSSYLICQGLSGRLDWQATLVVSRMPSRYHT